MSARRMLTALALGMVAQHLEAAPAYKLDWVAQGKSFFDNFIFNTTDANHGTVRYLERDDALSGGVAQPFDTHAVLRTGARATDPTVLKRDSIHVRSNKGWDNFLMVVKYSHLPYGCGLWPAFWTLGTDKEWPEAGELDVLEWAHDFGQQTSFHTGHSNRCQLDPDLMGRYGTMPDANHMNYDCVTDYGVGELGCAPNKVPFSSGEDMSKQGGVMAIEKTPEFAKVFHIPAAELPADIDSDSPDPLKWDKWVVSFYPFAESEARNPGSCPNPGSVMTQHQMIFNINLCGDWAGATWSFAGNCGGLGPKPPAECEVLDPQRTSVGFEHDCCTQFMLDNDGKFGTDAYLQEQAYFNISYAKVFQQTDDNLAEIVV